MHLLQDSFIFNKRWFFYPRISDSLNPFCCIWFKSLTCRLFMYVLDAFRDPLRSRPSPELPAVQPSLSVPLRPPRLLCLSGSSRFWSLVLVFHISSPFNVCFVFRVFRGVRSACCRLPNTSNERIRYRRFPAPQRNSGQTWLQMDLNHLFTFLHKLKHWMI